MKKTKEHKEKLSKALKGTYTGPDSWHFKDETGNKYNMLTFKKYIGQKKNRGSMWELMCDCGNSFIGDGAHVRNGHTKSCGCLLRRTGPQNHCWKGGRIKQPDGYIRIYSPDHPNSYRSYVTEHVLVMSGLLGRALFKNEIVHHRNGIRSDNRPENLELRVRKTHKPGQSINDLVKHAIETLKKYSPQSLK